MSIISNDVSRSILPSYPGNGIPEEYLGGEGLCSRPIQVAVIEWPVSVCHQWFKIGTWK